MNPARSLAPALFVGGWALAQLWVFIVFPIIGALIAGLAYRYLLDVPAKQRDVMEGRAKRPSDSVRSSRPPLLEPGRRGHRGARSGSHVAGPAGKR